MALINANLLIGWKINLPSQGFWPYKADDDSYGLSCVLASHTVLFNQEWKGALPDKANYQI